MTEEEYERQLLDFEKEIHKMAIEKYKLEVEDIKSARELAKQEIISAPKWSKAIASLVRPIWALGAFFLFAWSIFASSLGLPKIEFNDLHATIIKTIVFFYFGLRSVEKVLQLKWGSK